MSDGRINYDDPASANFGSSVYLAGLIDPATPEGLSMQTFSCWGPKIGRVEKYSASYVRRCDRGWGTIAVVGHRNPLVAVATALLNVAGSPCLCHECREAS